MSLNALVIGNNLAALVTAFRLQQDGFTVRIIEPPTSPISMERPSSLPVILHGPIEHTESLLQQMRAVSSLNSLLPVSLEFLHTSQDTKTFRHAYLPAPWHTLIGLIGFAGLSVSSRWKFFNYLEKVWEGVIHLSPDLHLQTAQDWLISCGQDEESQDRIWSPLCLFLLCDHLANTAAWPFIQALKQHFLNLRIHSKVKISSQGYADLLLSPLRKYIQQCGGAINQNAGIQQIRITEDRIEGIETENGQTHTADVYIATVSPFQLTALLPERTLARFGFFHQLNQLDTVPAVTLQFLLNESCPKPRLVLTNGQFSQMTWHPIQQDGNPHQSCISCVAIPHEEIQSLNDEALRTIALQEIQQVFHGFDTSDTQLILSSGVVRQSRAFITYSPGTMTFRPSHHTPLPNLYLAGHWIHSNATSQIEGDIQSAHLCTEMIKGQVV